MSSQPTIKTPVDRCEYMSLHTCAMLRKFKSVAALDGLADKLEDATSNMLKKHDIYREKVKALVVLRVEVRYIDLESDNVVRMRLKQAEIADGKPGGRVVATLFPNGSTPIIKPVGATQVKEMRALEGRYVEVEGIFPTAADERKKVEAARTEYEAALVGRNKGMEESAQARAGRNLAKEEYLDVFAEVAARIKAAFPRDKRMQDLFFLEERTAGSIEDGSEGGEGGEEAPAEGG
jgi:hypothetical protein